MVLDYKDIGKHKIRRPRGPRRKRRIFLLLLVVLAIVVGGYAYRSRRFLRRAGDMVRQHRIEDARQNLQRVVDSGVFEGRAYSSLAGLAALEGDASEARRLMGLAGGYGRRAPAIPTDVVFRRCFARADYELAVELGTFWWDSGRTDTVDFYLGAAQLALGRLTEAQAALARVDPVSEFGDRSNRLREKIKARGENPRRAVFLDRNRQPLAFHDPKDPRSLEVAQPALASLLGETPQSGLLGTLTEAELRQTWVLTIDEELELLADAALGKFAGSFVVLNPRTGAVLAHATHPTLEPRSWGWDDREFSGHYEPGSVIKLSTFVAALESDLPLDELFPYSCQGWMAVEGRQFFDWKSHGTVESLEEALAQSCNLVFARMGLELGQPAVEGQLRKFGFGLGPTGVFEFGRIKPDASGEWDLGKMSIGLDVLTATPIQVAVIAQALASDGVARRPQVVKEVLDVLDERIRETSPTPLHETVEDSRVASPETLARVRQAMVRVVTSEEGTGRRARLDAMAIAIKTGTAGDSKKGLDAIIVGFAPADDPQIAFGLIAANAGKAEYEGARIIRTFLDSAIKQGSLVPPAPEEAPLPEEEAPVATE